MTEHDEILTLLRENNRMLKEIITYITLVQTGADKENSEDFLRNVIANMISNNIQR